MIAFPNFPHDCFGTRHALRTNSHSLDVCIYMSSIAAMRCDWISNYTLIKKTLAGYIVINSKELRWSLILKKPFQLLPLYAQPGKVVPHWGARYDSATEKIKRQPPPFVFKVRLVAECTSTK